jgi:enamine deaminase RidA (YjgF/YER057c/UK114 family)
MAAYGLSEFTQVFNRVYLSDIENQKDLLNNSPLFFQLKNSAVTAIQQVPLMGGPVSLFSYHIKNKGEPFQRKHYNPSSLGWRNNILIRGAHYNMLWNMNYNGFGPFDSKKQTDEILQSITAVVEGNGMTLLDNTVRTWIYVRDIDNHYKGMVDSRREFFKKKKLIQDSRYLASTGIEGKSRYVNSLVTINALSISNLQKDQIIRMEALENLSPTIKYGVTFERGLRLRYGDRSHLYISGTASIDKSGEVLYPDDVKKQAVRILENINALLESQGASLKDMAYLVTYLRDPHSKDVVLDIIKQHIPENLPLIIVNGSVCRPAWLVEIEGVGIIGDDAAYPPFI